MNSSHLAAVFDALTALEAAGQRYVIIGGQAMVAHGLAEDRHDVDVMLEEYTALAVLRKAGFTRPLEFIPFRHGPLCREDASGRWCIDAFLRMPRDEQPTFGDCYLLSELREWYGRQVRVLTLQGLALTKHAARKNAGQKHAVDHDLVQLELIRLGLPLPPLPAADPAKVAFQRFVDPTQPCWFPGCAELRAQYEAAATKLKEEGCTGCEWGTLQHSYQIKLTAALAAHNA